MLSKGGNPSSHQLLARALDFRRRLGDVSLLSLLRCVEPSRDAQPVATVLAFSAHDDFFDRMEAAAWLDLEEDELVPAGRDRLGGDWLGLELAVRVFLHGVQLERATPLGLPQLIVGEGHVENVRHATRADHVVVVQEVAAWIRGG